MKPIRIAPPATGAVTLDDVRKYGRVDAAEDDTQLTLMMDAATGHLDGLSGILGRCLVTQGWRQRFGCWQDGFALPFPDVSAAVISYLDAAGAAQVVDPAQYELVEWAGRGAIRFRPGFSAPALDSDSALPVSVDLTAGFGDAAAVPAQLKVAIVRLGLHWYDYRSEVGKDSSVPFGVMSLIAPFRMSLL